MICLKLCNDFSNSCLYFERIKIKKVVLHRRVMIEWTVDCLAHVFCLMNHFESSVKAVRKASTHLTEEPIKNTEKIN